MYHERVEDISVKIIQRFAERYMSRTTLISSK